jgi:hypothetical protein
MKMPCREFASFLRLKRKTTLKKFKVCVVTTQTSHLCTGIMKTPFQSRETIPLKVIQDNKIITTEICMEFYKTAKCFTPLKGTVSRKSWRDECMGH